MRADAGGAGATLHCPKCNEPIGQSDATGRLDATCPDCRYAYSAILGRLERSGGGRIVLALPDGSRENVELGQDPPPGLLLGKGDVVAVLYWSGVRSPGNLAAIVCAEAGTAVVFPEPSARESAGRSGCLKGVVAALVASTVSYAFDWTLVAVLFGLVAAVGVIVVASSFFGHHVRLSAADRERLLAIRRLLKAQAEVDTRLASVRADAGRTEALMGELSRLRERMVKTGEEAYAARIAVVDRALAVLAEVRDADVRLVEEYERTREMIGIECDAARVAGQMPDGVADRLMARMQELGAASERNAVLRASVRV